MVTKQVKKYYLAVCHLEQKWTSQNNENLHHAINEDYCQTFDSRGDQFVIDFMPTNINRFVNEMCFYRIQALSDDERSENNCLNVHHDLRERVQSKPQFISKVMIWNESHNSGYFTVLTSYVSIFYYHCFISQQIIIMSKQCFYERKQNSADYRRKKKKINPEFSFLVHQPICYITAHYQKKFMHDIEKKYLFQIQVIFSSNLVLVNSIILIHHLVDICTIAYSVILQYL